jgi:cystinosin
VRGLSFEYQAYNITGYLCYFVFLLVTYVQHEHNDSESNPIDPNDIAFAGHSILLTVVTIYQCFIYKTERETINKYHAYIASLMWVILIYTLILAAAGSIDWYSSSHYSFISYLGYVKVAVSFVKYTPQAYMNYARKSTVGFSETGVLLDFTGGVLSFVQQFLDAYNSNDWSKLIGSSAIPKLLLALESVAFDIVFIIQHYLLYTKRESSYDNPYLGATNKSGDIRVVEEDYLYDGDNSVNKPFMPSTSNDQVVNGLFSSQAYGRPAAADHNNTTYTADNNSNSNEYKFFH